MRESAVERLLAERVRRLGGLSYKLLPSVVGMPDRMVIMPGGSITLVELKAQDGRLDPAQRLFHARLAALGVEVRVVRGAEEAKNFFP